MAVLGINCAGRWTNVGVAEGGAILAEQVFAMQGMGTLMTTAIRQKV